LAARRHVGWLRRIGIAAAEIAGIIVIVGGLVIGRVVGTAAEKPGAAGIVRGGRPVCPADVVKAGVPGQISAAAVAARC
jgi:hypothetical protein